MKIDALAFSFAGDKYLGRSYQEMDCQAFVERCMADCGYRQDRGGSNSWYRECMKNGWAGTPEECMKLFGIIPKGALLFIWEPVSENTPGKFRDDGIGDISHMGIKTGRNDGAIHSSYSRGEVVTSVFKDKTIKNGGWNRVGLLRDFDYGNPIRWYFDHTGSEESKPEEEGKRMTLTVVSDNGNPVNLRKSKNTKSDRIGKIPVGEEVEVISDEGSWCKIKWKNRTGWMLKEFLVTDDSGIPAEDPDDFEAADADPDQDGEEKIALYFTADELACILPVMQSACSQIIEKVGRG